VTRASGLAGDSVDVAAVTKTYERLAAMDPPAMRSLVVELTRIAHESSARAVRQGTLEAAARAGRNAQRAAAARAALALIEPSASSDARRSAAIDGKAHPLAQE
jgi:hypothetical protein